MRGRRIRYPFSENIAVLIPVSIAKTGRVQKMVANCDRGATDGQATFHIQGEVRHKVTDAKKVAYIVDQLPAQQTRVDSNSALPTEAKFGHLVYLQPPIVKCFQDKGAVLAQTCVK